MKTKRLISMLLLVMALSVPGICQYSDSEAILNYHSDITVNKDASMLVVETIKVRATGDSIKHGIYRDFPTSYKNKNGNRYIVRFEIVKVLRDGYDESYSIKGQTNGTRVYVGNADVTIPPGVYTYTIKYKTDRQLGFFKDHDELYWNVTGNGWDFPIEKASATVILPSGIPASSLKLEAYTGPQGSTAQDFQAHIGGSGRPYFEITSPLGAREGLTIVVSWPKGFIQEPTPAMKRAYFVRDNLGALIGLAGLIVVFLYYLFAWGAVGNDPEKGTIIPLYTPPDGLSPAAARYVRRMGYDTKAFAAAIINMAVKRYIKIEEEKKVYTVVRDQAEKAVLSPEENALVTTLLGTDDQVKLTNTHYRKIGGAGNALKNSLSKTYGKSYFSRNSWYLIPGVLLSFAALGFSAILSGVDRGIVFGFMGIWLTIWTIGVTVLVSQVIRSWKAVSYGGTAGCLGAGCLTLFAIPFVAGEILGLGALAISGSPLLVVLILAAAALNCIFYQLLKAPTVVGRKLLDQIDGFRMYLSVAEADTLNTMTPPTKTPELFEQYLPYALALDVEQQWAEKFADVLARAEIDGQSYHPDWYSGSRWSNIGVAGFASGLGSSFSSAISSSSTAPGSSSGSSGGGGGGGGSSGGGGGGGGGGGW